MIAVVYQVAKDVIICFAGNISLYAIAAGLGNEKAIRVFV